MLRDSVYWLSNGLQYVALAIVAAITLTSPLDPSRWEWWLAAGLSMAMGVLYYFWPRKRYHFYLAIETLLIVGLSALEGFAVMLGFALSAHAMILFPNRTGALWIMLGSVAAAAMMVYHEGWLTGLMVGLMVAGGYASFGYAYYARRRAEAARRESQSLLAELQTAHSQLQDYADRVEELTLAQERQRLAREIHDTLAQGFTSVVMHLEAAEAALPEELGEDASAVQHHLDQARQTAREGLAQARRLVWAMRPEILEGASLAAALRRVAARWAQESGIEAHVAITGTDCRLSPDVEVTLLRAVQEALANVRKHAQASQVTVTLSYMDDLVVLDVQDEGAGFDPALLDAPRAHEEAGGFGLTAMRERVEVLGGTLLVESAPGEGTTLVIEVPLPAAGRTGQETQVQSLETGETGRE